ncbi:MAG: Panacea domain-containing protein [Metallibacterium sp.]
MIKTHEREKLINAIVFFAKNTEHCGKIKLIKLLYLLDFEHFRQTGYSVTGMEYHAWKMGPVPTDLFEEWEALEPDLAAAIDIKPERVIDYVRERAVPKHEFNPEHFTRRELRIMQELAARFHDDLSQPMINVTHAEKSPWAKIWDNGRGKHQQVPYALAVADDDPHRDAILEAAADYAGMMAALGSTR